MSSLILWGLLWEFVGQIELTFFLPPLSAIFSTLMEIGGTKPFIKALQETAHAFSIGTLSAILIGVPTGILMGKSRLIDELLLPWVNLFLSAPLTALVPAISFAGDVGGAIHPVLAGPSFYRSKPPVTGEVKRPDPFMRPTRIRLLIDLRPVAPKRRRPQRLDRPPRPLG